MTDATEDLVDGTKTLMLDLLRLRPKWKGPEVGEKLKLELRAREGEWVLYLMLLADTDLCLALLPEVFGEVFNTRVTLLVREVLGRLPRKTLEAELLPLIDKQMLTAEYDEFRRMAELLEHLGLSEALRALVQRGSESDDPDIRDAATDY